MSQTIKTSYQSYYRQIMFLAHVVSEMRKVTEQKFTRWECRQVLTNMDRNIDFNSHIILFARSEANVPLTEEQTCQNGQS